MARLHSVWTVPARSLPNAPGRLGLALLAVGGLMGCQPDLTCDTGAIRERLERAAPGDVVSIGACTLPGGLTVPPGVTLEGVGRQNSAVEALPGNLVAIVVDTRPDVTTVLRGLRVVGRGLAIEVRGTGRARLNDLQIEVESGRGISVDADGNAELARIEIEGPIVEGNASEARWVSATEEDSGWIGIDVSANAEVSGSDINVHGMAFAGLVARDAVIDLDGLSIVETLGYGAILRGGRAELRSLIVDNTFQGLRGEPAIALAAEDVELVLNGAELLRSERYGFIARGGALSITDFQAENSGDAALWIGDASSVRMDGENEIRESSFAGLIIVDSSNLDIRNVTIRDTSSSIRSVGSGEVFGRLDIGDGLHLVGDLSTASFDQIQISGAARAGLLLELGAGTVPTFSNVQVEAASDGLGAVAGRAGMGQLELDVRAEPGWDDGVVRNVAAQMRDAAFVGTLDAARLAGPANLLE